MLHFSPERTLYTYLRNKRPKIYTFTDIDPSQYLFAKKHMQQGDIRALHFADHSFDLVVCNHVLEHVVEDEKAMQEIFRILKPGGRAILQVPVSYVLAKTKEDASVVGPDNREREFGQDDHVRIYTHDDYIARLKKAGFSVNESFRPTPEEMEGMAMDPRERLFVATK